MFICIQHINRESPFWYICNGWLYCTENNNTVLVVLQHILFFSLSLSFLISKTRYNHHHIHVEVLLDINTHIRLNARHIIFCILYMYVHIVYLIDLFAYNLWIIFLFIFLGCCCCFICIVLFLFSIRSEPRASARREKREDIYRELAHESSNSTTTMKFLIYESTRRVKLLE